MVKNPRDSAGDARDTGSIPGSGTSPGGGHGNPFQYSGLKNPMDRGAWWATVQSIAESDMTEVTHHVLTMPKYELVFPPRHVFLDSVQLHGNEKGLLPNFRGWW